ncbi:hypothetical protein JCGZ_17635 [Jatropha curcas]|uniref:Interferon-related developmental regulator N-terminal domain-containing protein n=1 Tax=Jatropha curcas TaxID=180498 RepID=A0A067JRG4_JATCU|nr:interferon-related developmental regulator 1 [Jatropha curcas]XP_037497779.1 interferon-related developmental regulator 1 [Jatropha curcas]KDP26477.1 hypothetical protein JCGZ_17635 [Jatropha curcas]
MNMCSSSKGKPSNGRTGSSISGRKGVVITDSDGSESFRSSRRKLEDYLIELSEKGKSKRGEALSAIVQELTMELRTEFVEKNSATLLYQCLSCLKKGSAMELELALKVIGLLAIILEDEGLAHEVYQDSVPVLSQVLESGSKKLNSLDCLGIVGVFCAKDPDETESVMLIIWKFLKPDSCHKHSTDVLAAAISTWSFLLTTIEGWRLNHKNWQDSISCLSNLLMESELSVYLAAAEALALIFEIDCLEKFSTEAKELTNANKQALKDDISEKLRCQSIKASEDGEEEEAEIDDVLKFFEAGELLEKSVKIGKDKLKFSTWSRRIQLNFVKRFLGEEGFVKHMRRNENLHTIFEFTPKGKDSTGNVHYTPDREEITVRFFKPKVQQKDGSLLPFMSNDAKQLVKKMTMSPNSPLNKARTQLLNKKRMLRSKGNDTIHSMNDDGTQVD